MSVLEDIRKREARTKVAPPESNNTDNPPTQAEISQGNDVKTAENNKNGEVQAGSAPDGYVKETADETVLSTAPEEEPINPANILKSEVEAGTPFTDAFMKAYASPEISNEEKQRAEKKEAIRRNIAVFGDAARLIGQGISAFNGGRVNIDNSSISDSNSRRENRLYHQYIDRVMKHKDGAYRANMSDLQYKLQEIARKRQQDRENAILSYQSYREDAKIKADREFKAGEAEKERKFKSEQNEIKNNVAKEVARIRKSGSSSEDKNYYIMLGSDGKTQYRIPKNAKQAVIGQAFSVLTDAIKDKPEDAKTISDIMIQYQPTDRAAAMEAVVLAMASKYPEIENYLKEFTSSSYPSDNSTRKTIPGFTSDKSTTRKQIPGF